MHLRSIIIPILGLSSLLLAQTQHYGFEDENLSTWQQKGLWRIETNGQNKAVRMVGRSHGAFNTCYTPKEHFLNGTVTVRFKANHGHIDQGGGIMWRVQDAGNYYVARFNPLEDNFRFYILHNGMRSLIASADGVTLSKGWHTMKIVQKGARFQGYLDGKRYLEANDNRIREAGGVGVWSKADADTTFDDLTIHTEP